MSRPTGIVKAATFVTLAIVAAFVFSSSAFAADNTSCLGCHGTTLSTAVTDVNRDTACEACHIPGLVGSHPYHQQGANCAGACHSGWGDSLATAIPFFNDPSGASFASETSKETSASVLHIIHSKPRWPAGVSTSFSECGSCHQAAACNACHTGAIASAIVGGKAQHGIHSSLGKPASSLPAYPAWTGTVGRGVIGVDQTVNSISTETNQCAAVGCHNLEGSASRRPDIIEDYLYGPGVNPEDLDGSNSAVGYVGTWRTRIHAIYTGGRASYGNAVGSQLNATFTGTRIEIISDKDPYRGKAEVWIDDVKQPETIDCYSSTTVNGAIVFSKGGLSAAGHTISVRPLNQKNAASRATYVLVDGFNVYGGLPESIAPNCTSCHPLQETGHGFSHEATHTAGFYGGRACTDCHSVNLVTEHARSSSKTKAATCAACHVTYAAYKLDTYDFTCGGTGATLLGAVQPCHSATQLAHTFTETTLVDAAHNDKNASPSAALAECWSCHGKNLVTIHSNSVTSNDPTYVTDCLTCHDTATFPAIADCTNTACHTGTGVHSMATHPAPAHPATNNGQATVPFTGGKACSSCHALEIANPATGEHAKSSSVTDPGSAAIGCVDCHAAAYFPAGWLGTLGTTNTCIACHPVAGGEAGAPHEADEYASKHDAAAVAAACAGTSGSVTLFTDGFESGNLTAGGWTNGGMINGATAHTGAYSAADGGTGMDYMEKTISTLGYTSPSLTAWFTSTGLDAGPEYLKIIVDGATVYTSGNTNAAWNQRIVALPIAGAVTIRFEVNTDNANDAFFIDDVLVTGQGGSCHNVSDLAAVHSNSVAAVTTADTLTCTVCHKNSTTVPTVLACASAGCHTGSSAHASLHATSASVACIQCHENASVQNQHAPATIGATVSGKPNDGCNICHGGDGWANVRSGLTDVECITCHNGSLVGAHIYQPYDANHYPVASHAGSGADAGISRTGSKTCATCHSLDMKAEHNKSCTSFALGAYVDTCVACHEIKVDTFTGAWDDTCLPCHAAASVHTAVGYAAAHDFATYNAANTASCGGANCHNVALADVIHSASLPGNGDCTSCHDTNTGVPTEHLCTDCHVSHNTAVAHASAQTECTGCHTSKVNVGSGHASCATCHANATLTDYLNDNYTATCTSCHALGAGKVGAYTYTPADANHYTPYLTNHTAAPWTAVSQGTGADGAVPALGKECSTCHTSTLKIAHATTSTSGGVVTCVECHTNSTLGSSAQVTANWSNQRCTDCHDTGAARTHDGMATEHVVSTTRGCAASGTSCHAFTDLAALHNVNQSGGTPKYASCANTGCHTAKDVRPAAFPLDSCGTGSTGCHTDKTVTNHGGKHDLDVATSNYVNATQSGCTNSGTGCHGSDATANIVTYHPTSGCTTGPCHTSADIGTHLQPHTCQGCHDGTYDNAPDTVALTDVFPIGHYNETTHTATPATTANAGGTTTAACTVCHNPANVSGIDGLYYQHQGLQTLGATTCSECHNANATVAALVTDATRTNTCLACHTVGVLPTMAQHSTSSRVPVNATEADGAGTCVKSGCHTTLDLHQLHKGNGGTDPSCTESLCHDSTKQGWKPTAKSCGTGGLCHKTDEHDPAAHITLASSACVVCHESADLQVVHGGITGCSKCHGNATYPTLPFGKLECVSCHVAGTVGTKTYTPVDASHYTGTTLAHTASAQGGTVSGFACTQCHKTEMRPEHMVKTTSVFSSVPGTYADKCIACHEGPVDAWNGTPWVKTCDACHATKHTATTTKHNASTAGAACAPTPQVVTVASENFDGGAATAYWPATWARSSAAIILTSTTQKSSAPNAARFEASNTTFNFSRTFDLSGYSSPQISFWRYTTGLDAGETLYVAYSTNGGTSWTPIYAASSATGTGVYGPVALPVASNVLIKFEATGPDAGEQIYIDDILITGTAAIGCHNVADVGALHALSASSCSACHKNSDTIPTTLTCTTVGCHSSGANHDSLHVYSNASNYTQGADTVASEAGCLNSGAGCHGTDTTFTNGATTYHAADTGCLTGVCHSSTTMTPAWKSAGSGMECSRCHAGNYVGAPDTIALSDLSTAGHYVDGLHTATAGLGTVAAGGSATAACSVCHDLSLKGAHGAAGGGFSSASKGTYVTCRECHEYNAALTSEVKTLNWQNNDCTDCHNTTDMGAGQVMHNATTAPAVTASVSTGCGASGIGCHTSNDLHAVHKNASGGCVLSGCHAKNKDMTTASKSCGQAAGCHTSDKYSALQHNGTSGAGLANGTDATHHTAGATQMNNTWLYSGKTTACSACHGAVLGTEHARSTSTLSGTGTNACLKCHNDSATVAGIVTTSWPNKNTTTSCSSCHANTDGTSAATAHGAVATAHTATSVTGCTAVGAGCHGTSATPDLTTVHATGCAQTRACHSPTVYNPGIKACTNVACHPTATYSTTTYVHGSTNGDDANHQVTAPAMATTVGFGSGTTTAACSVCHSTTLKTAHSGAAGFATNSLGVPWTTATTGSCLGCHNATSPINVATMVANNTWTNTCTSGGCHNTTQQAHVDGGTDAPAVMGINTTTPSCTKAGCHATLELHELHNNAVGGCGLTDPNGGCHNAANLNKRPTQKTCGNTGGCHVGIQNDAGHGVSPGGIACDVCHTALNGMVNDTTTYHHVLDAASPFQAPANGTYPNSPTVLSCVSCHVDHSKYAPLPGIGKAFSLRDSGTNTNPAATDTDEGLCLSCHTAQLDRNVTGQKANIIPETKVWALNATWWAVSPHNYDSPGAFNDGSVFRANCAKCHGSLIGTLSSGKFATHFSAEQRLLNALGDATTPNVNEEQMCFRCHSKTTDALAGTKKPSTYFDWYGTQPMGESNVVIYSQMNSGVNTYGHKPHLYANKHLLSDADETQAYINANKHVECADCHNHHVVGDVRHEWGTTNLVSEAIRGVTGQGYATGALTTLSTINFPTTAQVDAGLAWKTNSTYEYEICFKCHSSANTQLATWGGNKTGATTQPRWTNVAADFNVGNQSRHPVIAPNDAYPDTTTYGTSKVAAGQLSGIWAPGDTMYCSDCHGDSEAPLAGDPDNANHAQGPHGSAVQYSLRGPNKSWPTNSAGTLWTIDMVEIAVASNPVGELPFCANCHLNIKGNQAHIKNALHQSGPCTQCHIIIPHGGGMSRLIGDGNGAMPARYAYNNDKSTMLVASFRKQAVATSYTVADCGVTTSACSKGASPHTIGNVTGHENW